MKKESTDILLVEDNPADARLVSIALSERGVDRTLHVVKDGIEALAFLRGQEGYEDKPRPALILLDWNLPRMDGRQVLEEIKRDPQLKSIPVIVLTTSQAERDVADAYALQANSFITKPVDLDSFLDAIRIVEEFWLKLAKLPSFRGEAP